MGAVAVLQAFRALEATYPQLRAFQGSAKIRELAYLVKSPDDLRVALNLVQDREVRQLIAARVRSRVPFEIPEVE